MGSIMSVRVTHLAWPAISSARSCGHTQALKMPSYRDSNMESVYFLLLLPPLLTLCLVKSFTFALIVVSAQVSEICLFFSSPSESMI